MRFVGLARTSGEQRFLVEWSERQPCLDDSARFTPFDAHYVLHTSWTARCLVRHPPLLHVDFSSDLRFTSLLSASIPMVALDYRPAAISLPGFNPVGGDLRHLPFPSGSLSSVSCMHVIEHVGLGRYGDALDPQGDLAAAKEIARVVAPGGRLLLVLPVGARGTVHFNAHRIYRLDQALALFPSWRLNSSALITDAGRLIENPDPTLFSRQSYGCGCFDLECPEPPCC